MMARFTVALVPLLAILSVPAQAHDPNAKGACLAPEKAPPTEGVASMGTLIIRNRCNEALTVVLCEKRPGAAPTKFAPPQNLPAYGEQYWTVPSWATGFGDLDMPPVSLLPKVCASYDCAEVICARESF